MHKKGFTLIELMIVIAIIAIIAAIAIPGLLRARISGNEGSAVGSLRTMSTSQAQAQSSAIIDQDRDGTGEFLTLGELCGSYCLRGSTGASQERNADPGYITKALSPEGSLATEGWGSKSGYFFKVYLPGDAATVTDVGASTTGLNGEQDNANYQEVKFRAYAWPASARSSGNRAFAVDQSGEVFACANLLGNTTNPAWTATTSMIYSDGVTASMDGFTMPCNIQKGVGGQGQEWKPAS